MKKAISILLSLALTLAMAAGCSTAAPRMFESGDFFYSPAVGGNNSASGSYAADSGGFGGYSYGTAAPSEYYDDEDWRYAPFDETNEYASARETPFKDVVTSPLSTFSASVDTASYSIMRRQIINGYKPESLRIEELVNYFDYSYPAPPPGSEHPFSVITEISECPWAPGNMLAMIGIQGARLQNTEEIANNIVFLIDVSGSMDTPDRLPLVIESMKLLVNQLSHKDVISIVTYAGSDRIIADSVPGSEKQTLTRLLGNLKAGGSTAGAQGLKTAYELASKNFIEGGNNRIILATDGDFNVGLSSVSAIIDLVEKERDRGVFISVLGYGMGNLKDTTMEAIATNGNGNYAYIDNIQEAKKVLVDEFDSTMFTIAKDVKIQIEFNPETISAYRLIGYETRRLENEDFNNDLKDAGEIGSGHSVTAFYELIPVGADVDEGGGSGSVDPLRYSSTVSTGSDDFMTVKIRYKEPDGDESKLVEHILGASALERSVSYNFLFASAVAEFGLIATDSNYKGHSSLANVLARAKDAKGTDFYGLRAEFLDLVQLYGRMVDR